MKTFTKAGLIGKVFLKGAANAASSSTVASIAMTAGLYQGLKYKGDFKNGIATTAAVYGSAVVAQGLFNVVWNANLIKNADGYMVDDKGNISTYQVKD